MIKRTSLCVFVWFITIPHWSAAFQILKQQAALRSSNVGKYQTSSSQMGRQITEAGAHSRQCQEWSLAEIRRVKYRWRIKQLFSLRRRVSLSFTFWWLATKTVDWSLSELGQNYAYFSCTCDVLLGTCQLCFKLAPKSKHSRLTEKISLNVCNIHKCERNTNQMSLCFYSV